MKKTALLFFTFILLGRLSAQEIKISTVFSSGSFMRFQTGIGYGLGIDIKSKSKNKLGFAFAHSFNSFEYSYKYLDLSQGKAHHREVKPNNQMFSFTGSYGFGVLNRPKSRLFIGPTLGVNYFRINEAIRQTEVNTTETRSITDKDWVRHKIGTGLLVEYQKSVIPDKLWLSLSAESKLMFYSIPGLLGSNEPFVSGWWNFKLNFVFKLAKSKASE